jgi:hypothetical protein
VLERATRLEPVAPRHHDVHQHEIGLFAHDEIERFVAIRCGEDGVAVAHELSGQQTQVRGFVVDDDDTSDVGAGLDWTALRAGLGRLLVVGIRWC